MLICLTPFQLYDELLDIPIYASTTKKFFMNQKIVDISRDFLDTMASFGKIIISERYVPVCLPKGNSLVTK